MNLTTTNTLRLPVCPPALIIAVPAQSAISIDVDPDIIENTDQTDGDGDGFGNAYDTDLSGDCITNVVDLGFLRTVFFTSDMAADFNVDGAVNFVDLDFFRTRFLRPPGPSALLRATDGQKMPSTWVFLTA